MNYKLDGLNLVVVFSDTGKHAIEINELTNLFTKEAPAIFWDNQIPTSPGIISYQISGFDISIFENRYQIQSKAIDGDIPSYFQKTLKKALLAAKTRYAIAYGFNFYFSYKESREVKDIFNITIRPTSFSYQPATFLKLTFKKEDALFIIEVSDGKPALGVHINIHHDENLVLEVLAEKIEEKLSNDFEATKQLLSEVFGIAK
ncbi:MAG: hypothetical protein PWQ23_126 [Thermoanaerobacter sp.]|jgi:hypothetical protein|nr:hypothetical protein [Thermoanaerobacter sp.]